MLCWFFFPLQAIRFFLDPFDNTFLMCFDINRLEGHEAIGSYRRSLEVLTVVILALSQLPLLVLPDLILRCHSSLFS